MPARDTIQGTFIKEHFQTIWPVHLGGFTNLLIQLRTRFGGDLDLALVLAVIGSRTRPEHWTSALTDLDKMTHGVAPGGAQRPINIQSVTDYSGIPRETVRRKVNILERKGWIMREADGCLAVTPNAGAELQDATGDTIAYLASLLTAFEAARAMGTDRQEQP